MDTAMDETKERKHAEEGDDSEKQHQAEEQDLGSGPESESKDDESSDTKKGGDTEESNDELDWLETEEDKANYHKYIQELREHGPYGITTKFDGIMFGVVVPFNLSGPAKSDLKIMTSICHEAIKQYMPGHELDQIIHACFGQDENLVFYLTVTARDPANPSSQSRAYQFKYSFHREEVEDFTPIQNTNPRIVEFQRVRKAIATGQAATSN